MITMQAVARRAGVSRAAVSHVLNGRAQTVGLRPDTCRRIRQALTETGYRRNEVARAMVKGCTRIIAFLAPSLRENYCSEALDGVLAEANRRNLFVKVFTWRGADRSAEFARILDRCFQAQPLGIIARGLQADETALLHAAVKAENLPVAALDSSATACPGGTRVRADDAAGIKLAWQHLWALGHRRIIHLTGPAELEYVRLRGAAFQACMRRAHGRADENAIGYGQEKDFPAIVQGWFGQAPTRRPTAAICASDNIAALLVRLLRDMGLRVPDDVAVTGFGDLSISRYCDPPLTTIFQPFQRMGARVLQQVLISGNRPAPEKFQDIILPVKLLKRASTGPVRRHRRSAWN